MSHTGHYRQSLPGHIFDSANYLCLFVFSLLCLYPFLHVVFASFSTPEGLNSSFGIMLGPQGFNLKGYELTFKFNGIVTGYLNTTFYVTAGTALNVFFTGLLAYVLASKAYWKKHMMILVVFTMFFNGGLIPTFLLVRSLHLLNSRWAMLLPGLISAWNLIIMRTYFMAIPDSLEESARIDGASPYRILFSIVVPLSAPVVAVMVLYYGVGHWNSWFNALIYLRDRKLFPLQLFLREILIQNVYTAELADGLRPTDYRIATEVNEEILKNAFIVIATIPIVCLYPFLQRYFIKGVMIGALKG